MTDQANDPLERPISAFLLRPWFLLTLVALGYALLVVAINDGDPLELVTIGTRFSEGIAEEDGGTEGYDGQFVYFIARDAATADFLIAQGGDFPAYRYQRVLLPALGGVFSLGETGWIPYALLAVNLIALAAGTAVIETMLVSQGVSRWYVVGWTISLAGLGTVRLSLPEPLAYALAAGAIMLALDQRYIPSAILIAMAALAKETTLVFGASIGIYLLLQRRWQDAIIFGVIGLLPFALWQGFLLDRFGELGVGSGGAGTTGFTPIPFGGVIAIVIEAARVVFEGISDGDVSVVNGIFRLVVGLGIFAAILGPLVIAPTIWALRHSGRALRQADGPSLLVVLLFMNGLVMLFVPFSTYREPLGILRFIAGLQIALILYAAQTNNQRVLRNSTLWLTTLFFLVGSDLAGGTPGG